ncbi:hypothetical protein LJR042_003570 [Microbacterium maritypicum]|uniref:hypothetical protein n=1 Tax=Microbacterium maritypicum TaxID=33918 RepID=UPI003ED08BBD
MRSRSLAALALVALFLTGCSSAAPISEDEYLASADGLTSFDGMSDDDLIEYGEAYCEYLREHGDGTEEGRARASEIFLAADVDAGGDLAETAIVAGHAVQRFCPEFRTD